jgi:hypothetical protein
MPNGKHRITKEKADRLITGMKDLISSPGGPLQGFPEGFIFDVDAVRKLVNHPDAAHFIIRFGWKVEEKGIAPILCVADKNKKVLEKGGGQPVSANTRSIMKAAEEPARDEDAGGYLDEGTKFP